MNEIQIYLNRIVRWSGLTRREQTEWVEEMSAHLVDDVEHLKETGHSEEEAVRIALNRFGSQRDIRKQVARQTFGVSLTVITLFAAIFSMLFLVGVYLVYASVTTNADPSTWSNWHENSWVYFFTARFPLSPSLMLALCLDTIMLLRTRCIRDRWALALITGIYCALWLFTRISHNYGIATLLVPLRSFYLSPFGTFAMISYLLLFCSSICIYILTKNRSVSRFPIVLSLALGLWLPIKNAVQFHLWQATQWSALWGHYDPFMGINGIRAFIIITILILLLVLLTYVFRVIDRFYTLKRSTAST